MENFSYLNNANGAYLDEMYQRYRQDPQSIEPSWQQFFQGYEFGLQEADSGAAAGSDGVAAVPPPKRAYSGGSRGGEDSMSGEVTNLAVSDKEVSVMKMINAYRGRGHLVANTNPVRPRRYHKADLELSYFGLSDADLDTEFETGNEIRIGRATLRDIVAHLSETYCGAIGVEFRNIGDSAIRMWLHEAMETTANQTELSRDERLGVLKMLARAVGFEKFLHVRYSGQKRFSLEGNESFIPALETVFSHGSKLGCQEFVMGMAHRGRLNVLVNLFGKPYANMFSEFEGNFLPEDVHGDGDVKYHQGHSADIVTESGGLVHLSLLANPSHLEAVDPVVLGSTYAKGHRLYEGDFTRICPILVHGDAAVAGQGVIYEIANMAGLTGFSTGGTVHVVINNQVGFTANYRETRSSLYCTDIAKVTDSPVFHVNADDPEAVVHVMRLAIELRQRFSTDVYIDMLGYRRYGHNESDDPHFTQPLLYDAIGKHPTVLDIYCDELVQKGVFTRDECNAVIKDFDKLLDDSQKEAREKKPAIDINFLGRQWKGYRRSMPEDFERSPETGVDRKRLNSIVDAICHVPDGFTVYPRMQRIFDGRRKLYEAGDVDWGLAELMAYGSLLCENVPVRMTGQDCRRGTFAHRHAVFIDATDESEYIPLNHIRKKQEQIEIYNSHLSEYAVMGFEYGYTLVMPQALVLWEAQFGDFSNGAQIIIDQFLSSGESKWQRMSGLVLLLPHGYEGMGPEHSSARLGRYLDLCAEDNVIVANITTPANLFHVLRRQALCSFRKPLIIMSPKSLLRNPLVRSPIAQLVDGHFQEILDDPKTNPADVTRVVLCSGKIYYELLEQRTADNRDDVAIVRIEQFYPVPHTQDAALMARYAHVKEWVWAQEEPVNMGAWAFMRNRLKALPHEMRVTSRHESASPATGSLRLHTVGQVRLVKRAFEAFDTLDS